MKFEVSVSTNKRSYSSLELGIGEIEANNSVEAIDNFWEALKDASADNNKHLDFDGNKVFEVDNETGDKDTEYYFYDSVDTVKL